MALSMAEDVLSIGLTWLTAHHPVLATSIAAVFVLIVVLLIRWVWQALRRLFRGAEQVVRA
jgi:hypothetical protein